MKRILTFATSLLALSALFVSAPASGAPTGVRVGTSCAKIGIKTTVGSLFLICSKTGKKLSWIKLRTNVGNPNTGLSTIPSAASTAVGTSIQTPAPTPTAHIYIAKDQTTIHHLIDSEGCSNPAMTKAEIQAKVDDNWVPVKAVNLGWGTNPQACPAEQFGKKTSLAWADVYMDQGVSYRWYFIGEVNIFHHDQAGNGYSETLVMPTFIQPHSIVGGYGLTWSNIASRIADISAASWTDAQETIKRNEGLPSAADGFTAYISPGALNVDSKLSESEVVLRRTFTLFQPFPAAQRVFFVALTIPERITTEDKLNTLYSKAQFMIKSMDEMVGINNSLPAGSSAVWPTDCRGANIVRNTFFYKAQAEASALIWYVCPDIQNNNLHFEGVQGMAHEYIHTIQFAFKPGSGDGFATVPCWMREGEPEWGQMAAASNFSNYLKAQHLHPYRLTSDGLNFENTPTREWQADEVAAYLKAASNVLSCSLTNEYAYSYSLGTATTEALVGLAGSESILALHQRIVAGIDFNTAFTEIFGISWSEAIPILAEVVATKITKSLGPDGLTYQTRPQE